MEFWHVLYTKPHNEFRVQAALEKKDIPTFLPALPVAKARAGRKPLQAFFPCYLFAQFDLELVGESQIVFLPGLRYLVKTAGVPTTVSPALIHHISKRLAESKMLAAGSQILTPGDPVEVLVPGFEEFDVVFDARLSAEGRVRLLVNYMNKQYPAYKSITLSKAIEIDIENIRKKPPPVKI